ncbi:MAG TPA: hypothetical protein EYP32_01425 [Aquificaceae bacterium]|nr:hypothetical protein [Aquificaceae bacterium]HIQ48307.1 hypothetical protein [Aquifex aeolicus]
MLLIFLSFTVSILSAQPWYLRDCIEKVIDAKIALDIAERYTGKVYKLYLTKRKSTGECLYKIKGLKGTAIVDGFTGKLIKFYKKR